jgi:hypothetical protein
MAVMQSFPREIEDFGNIFAQMQVRRVAADYNPLSRFTRSEVLRQIDASETAIQGFGRCTLKDRRAFAAWVTIRERS